MASYRLPCKNGEEWRPAKLLNHETRILEDLPDYFVSNIGRMCHKVDNKYKLMKLSKTPEGYLTCNIGKNRKKVHRIVASTFLDIPDNIEHPIVDHINTIKTDNRVGNPYSEIEEERGNLQWVTFQENTQSAYDKDLIGDRKMMKILVVDENENGILYKNQRIASEVTGIDAKRISQVVRGLHKTAGKYRFVRLNKFEDCSESELPTT